MVSVEHRSGLGPGIPLGDGVRACTRCAVEVTDNVYNREVIPALAEPLRRQSV